MLERKIMQHLITWKEQEERLPLVVRGARQVGKTYIIDHFCREQYENYIYINFDENPAYQAIFEGDLDVKTIVKQITLRVPGADIVEGKTIIFLDEIQNCPKARTALKFMARTPLFSVIASGSLLGINYKDVPSFPVGYTEQLEMFSMDFEEFLWANGVKKQSIADIRDYFERKESVPQAMHERMMQLFREYIVVGGMPYVVDTFVKRNSFSAVFQIQRAILNDYAEDIAKYGEGAEKTKARACFLSIPKHLAKDYKKFRYSLVEKGGSSRKYGGSLMWLYDAGIINFCYNLSAPELPLEGNARSDAFKVYMRDTGLLVAMLEEGSAQDIIDGNLGIYKGAIYENIVADLLGKKGKKLYYFEKNNSVETDFIIRREGKATLLEVKSSENTKSKSMESMINHYGIQKAIRLSARKEITQNEIVEAYPLYMAMFL